MAEGTLFDAEIWKDDGMDDIQYVQYMAALSKDEVTAVVVVVHNLIWLHG